MKVIICDDYSTDKSFEILKEYNYKEAKTFRIKRVWNL